MGLYGRQYTVTATATQPLAAAAGKGGVDTTSTTNPGHIQVCQLDFKAKVGNTGVVYIGNSNVTAAPANALITLNATATTAEGYTCGPYTNPSVYADDFWVIGTAGDIVFINLIPF